MFYLLSKLCVIEHHVRVTDVVDHGVQLVPGGLLGGVGQPVHLLHQALELLLNFVGQVQHLKEISAVELK